MVCSSPQLPSSFDPAIHLHSDFDHNDLHSVDPPVPPSSHADELEALHLQVAETAAARTRDGVVIQHRAWRLQDVFRSDSDCLVDTPLKRLRPVTTPTTRSHSHSNTVIPPSSPPSIHMPLMSSPPAYPATSSPPQSPRKRRKLDERRDPLKKTDGNKAKVFGGFIMDDDSDDEDDAMPRIKPPTTRTNLLAELDELPPVTAYFSQPAQSQQENQEAIEAPQEPPMQLDDTPPSTLDPSKRPQTMTTSTGRTFYVAQRRPSPKQTYEQLIASRSAAAPGRARTSYYGIDIHQLLDDAAAENAAALAQAQREAEADAEAALRRSVEQSPPSKSSKPSRTLMWTEKYRARKFTDLVGDERTHRAVLKWLKSWDPIVFPGLSRHRAKKARSTAMTGGAEESEPQRKKILLLTGPPGLGKTTLAHVCARQAGYEVQEINASDERSGNVVRGRIRDMVGTENVRGVEAKAENGAKVRKAGRPVAVVVDEVDGVVGGNTGGGGGGEGGFIKALIDLVNLDARNAATTGGGSHAPARKKKGDRFRLLRPLILICNDVYHPALRPLRQSGVAEIVHVRKPPLAMVAQRLYEIFVREGVPADADGVRRLCEATWGVTSRKEGGSGAGAGTGDGDLRGVLVVGEWVARRLRAAGGPDTETPRLTRQWVEQSLLDSLAHGGDASRSLGRGGVREIVERVFTEGGGFARTPGRDDATSTSAAAAAGPIGVAEAHKRRAIERLTEMIHTAGDGVERIVTECFATYPTQPYQDDTFLSKPDRALSWLGFADGLLAAVHARQAWELHPYLATPVLAFHDLFAASTRFTANTTASASAAADALDAAAQVHPFLTPHAPFAAADALKLHSATLASLAQGLPLPLARHFPGGGGATTTARLAAELLPWLLRMLSPRVAPVVLSAGGGGGGAKGPSMASTTATATVRRESERVLVRRAAGVMVATGLGMERVRVDHDAGVGAAAAAGAGGWVWRFVPDVEGWGAFEMLSRSAGEGAGGAGKVRFAVRQVVEGEWRAEVKRLEGVRAVRRGGGVGGVGGAVAAGVDGEVEERKDGEAKVEVPRKVKRDFFGRVIEGGQAVAAGGGKEDGSEDGSMGIGRKRRKVDGGEDGEAGEGRVWVSFHEGFSNAVRKPVTLGELMAGL